MQMSGVLYIWRSKLNQGRIVIGGLAATLRHVDYNSQNWIRVYFLWKKLTECPIWISESTSVPLSIFIFMSLVLADAGVSGPMDAIPVWPVLVLAKNSVMCISDTSTARDGCLARKIRLLKTTIRVLEYLTHLINKFMIRERVAMAYNFPST